jgi:hypothetical protein
MPHILVRELDGTFVFGKARWANKVVGDEHSNPIPSFANKVIQNFSYTQNRLGLLCADSIVWSETDQPYNFFKTTVVNELATQPIDLDIIDTNSSQMRHMTPLEGDVLMFSAQAQLVLNLSSGFTFDTVSLSQSTQTELITDVAPQTLSKNILYCFPRGDGFGLGQFAIEPETLKLRDFDLSEQVPTYLEGTPKQILTYPNDNMIFIRSDGLADGVYFYRFLDRNQKRVQSAFGKISFGEDARVDHCYRIGSDVYFVITRTGGTHVERMNPSRVGLNEETVGGRVVALLDRRVSDTDCTLSYNESLDATTVTLPYSIRENDNPIAIVPKDTPKDSPVFYESSVQGDNEAYFEGDFRGMSFWIGRSYECRVDLTMPVVQKDGEAVTGEYRFAVLGLAKEVSVSLLNDTPFASKWLSLAWSGRFTKLRQSI